MTEPTETTTPASPEPKAETRRDEFMEAPAKNPRFKLLPRRGAGFILPAKG